MSSGATSPTDTFAFGYDVHGSVSTLLQTGGSSSNTVKAVYGYRPHGAADTDLTSGDTLADSLVNPVRCSGRAKS